MKLSTLVIRLGLACLIFFSCFASFPTMAEGPQPATPAPPFPLHGDWFKLRYDEIKDMTYVVSNDDGFGPGNPERTSAGDVVKLDVSVSMEGKVFLGNTALSAYIDFSRMAGVLMAQGGLLSNSSNMPQDRLENYKGYQERLFLLNDLSEAYFLLPSGERLKITGDAISYNTKKSQGILGEKYIWEIATVRFTWDELNQLRDGAKIALGPVEFALTKDSISQIRTVIMIVEDQAPKDQK